MKVVRSRNMGNDKENEDVLKSCDRRMLFRYMTGETLKDTFSNEKIATRCGLNKLQG